MIPLLKRIHTLRIGQIVGLGFGLTLCLALLVGLSGRLAYEISKRQNAIIQTRSQVDSLTMELEIRAIQRTETLRHYLDTENAAYLLAFQENNTAYKDALDSLAALLNRPEEHLAWQAVVAAEKAFDDKAREVFRLYDNHFPGSARFLWASEGLAAQDHLLKNINALRQIQNTVSAEIINQARQTETAAIITVSVFIILVLIGGIAASLIITRVITSPLGHLVTQTTAMGNNLSQRVTPSGPAEIAFLGQTINTMADHLTQSRQELQQHSYRLEHELTLASQIQASFFPDTLPQLPGLELAAYWQPAREMGGDFYTCINLGNGQICLVVGDVSGKGAPAAMAGALAVGLLEAYAPAHRAPEVLLARLNQDLYARFIANYINVACCYTIIDTKNAHLTVANAGCVFPYLRRHNDLHEIEAVGLPLGMSPDINYHAQTVHLAPGDLLLLSSDGLIEARNRHGELFGFDRLETELRSLPPFTTAQTAVDRLVRAALTFTGQTDLADDLTVLVVRVV